MKLSHEGSEAGAFVGMVTGYWEQACLLLNYELLHEELFFETSGEFFGVWEQLKPVVADFRKQFGDQQMLENLEKAALRFEKWSEKRSPGSIENMRKYMTQLGEKSKSAKGAKA